MYFFLCSSYIKTKLSHTHTNIINVSPRTFFPGGKGCCFCLFFFVLFSHYFLNLNFFCISIFLYRFFCHRIFIIIIKLENDILVSSFFHSFIHSLNEFFFSNFFKSLDSLHYLTIFFAVFLKCFEIFFFQSLKVSLCQIYIDYHYVICVCVCVSEFVTIIFTLFWH